MRAVVGWRAWSEAAQDLRYAVRSLVKHRGFTATALSALALGIGANTAIFSVVSGVLLRPLPFADPDRLVQLYGTPVERGEAIAWADVEAFRSQSASFDALAGYGVSARYLHGPDGAERVMTVEAEHSFFPVLGAAAIMGRTFQPGDPADVAVVSHAFWTLRLGGDPSVIGRAVRLDGEPFTIIGVMPDSFQFPYGAASLLPGVASETRTDLWIPLVPQNREARRFPPGRLSYVTGRLTANVAPSAAESELAVIMKRLEAEYPDSNTDLGVRVAPLSEAVVAPALRRSLFFLFGAVGFVLALACANVTNLSLVRMTVRSREVAVRAALGAGPLRLVRQFLTESLLLSSAGGIAGLGLAWWGTGRVMQLAAPHLPRSHEVGLDWRVFVFLLGACAVTGAVVGLAPAISAMRTEAQSTLKESGGHATVGVSHRRLRDGLVIAEVAIAFVLGVGATLLVRELVRLRNTDPGMVTGNVVTFHVGGQPPATDGSQFDEIAERVAELPGVRNAGFTQLLPLQSWGWSANASDFTIRGRPTPASPPRLIELRYVTPGYFQALGIPIRRGRAFTARDDRDGPPVIVINETLARQQFSGDDPIGQETSRGTIVGVVGDVRQVHLDRPALPEIYYPIAQNWSQVRELGMSLVVRTESRPLAAIDAIRAVVRELNPNLAIFDVRTMERVVADSLSDFTLYLSLMAGFAALALVLAATGTYGVISYVATSRTREFAIRAALGAERARVTRLVVGQAVRLTAIGLGCGLLGALAAAPLLQDLPVSVRPPDLATITTVALIVGGTAVVACLVPARRAGRVDPMSALRSE